MKILVPFLLLVAAIGGFFYYIQPGYADIQRQQKEIDQYNNALEKAQEFAQVRDKLIGELNQVPTPDLERLKKMIPDNIDSTKLVIEINEIARQNNLDIKNIRISELKTQGAEAARSRSERFNTLSLGFNVSARYENIINFLKDVEANLRLADVSNVAITTGAEAAGVYTVDLTLRTYWLKSIQ